MKVYDVIEDTYEDGSEDCQSIGIFDTPDKAKAVCEKLSRSIMYDSRQNRRYFVRPRELNEYKMTGEIPKEGWVTLKLRYRYTGGNTTDPMHYILICEWFIGKFIDEKLTSDCVISYLPVIANEAKNDFEQRRFEKFHKMWKMLNNHRRENNLVTLPFSISC